MVLYFYRLLNDKKLVLFRHLCVGVSLCNSLVLYSQQLQVVQAIHSLTRDRIAK